MNTAARPHSTSPLIVQLLLQAGRLRQEDLATIREAQSKENRPLEEILIRKNLASERDVAAKDGYAHSHLEKVATQAVRFGESLGLDSAELKILKYGAILHNVGKIAIPDVVLEKAGPLTPREMAMFQQHPRVGCDICAPLKPLRPVLPIIRHHKEHWDGTGFPDGLRGEEIPLGAQIVNMVDVYAALTSDRPYRKAVSHAEAVARLQGQAQDGHHNPDLVKRFIECLEAANRSKNSGDAAASAAR